jgi:acetyl esterase/lipase
MTQAVQAAVERHDDLVFARPDGEELALDLYLPAERHGPLPVVLHLHGGGWVVGSRKDFTERLHRLAAAGVAVAAADYRLSRVAAYPAQLEDARAAVAWLRETGERFGLATERIGAWGASAGGHLATMLGLTTGAAESEVQAVVSWFGASDLTADGAPAPAPGIPLPAFLAATPMPAEVGNPPDPPVEARLLGVADVRDAPEAARAASPIAHVRADAPPLLLVHGDADGLVAIEHSRRLHAATLAAGGRSSLLIVAGANHEDELFDGPEVIGAVAGFLRFHLEGDR